MTEQPTVIHARWLRVSHWLNALAVLLLVMSGWRIYNASPFFAFRMPKEITLGGWLGGALLWHFVAIAVMVAFVAVHLVMVALVPRSLLTMIRGS